MSRLGPLPRRGRSLNLSHEEASREPAARALDDATGIWFCGGDRPPADPENAFLTVERDNVVTRSGFGLLPGAIVDQHFVRRKRSNRLLSLVLESPQLVAIGIDESTALEVGPDGLWRVRGAGVAVVYDTRDARVATQGAHQLAAADVRVHVLPSGSRFDPATRQVTLPPAR